MNAWHMLPVFGAFVEGVAVGVIIGAFLLEKYLRKHKKIRD